MEYYASYCTVHLTFIFMIDECFDYQIEIGSNLLSLFNQFEDYVLLAALRFNSKQSI